MQKSNPHSQKMYVNSGEIYSLRAPLASSTNPGAKISTFLKFHIQNYSAEHSVALRTADAEELLELWLSPAGVARICKMLLATSVLLRGPLQPQAALPLAGSLSLLPLFLAFFSHSHLIFMQEKNNKFLPLIQRELLFSTHALGLRLSQKSLAGKEQWGSDSLPPAFLMALSPHQESCALEELGASC